MSIFGDIMSAIFRPFGQGGNPRSRHRGAFSLKSAASLASSVRHHDKNRTGSRGSEG
jgi:hypothetical protein